MRTHETCGAGNGDTECRLGGWIAALGRRPRRRAAGAAGLQRQAQDQADRITHNRVLPDADLTSRACAVMDISEEGNIAVPAN